MAESNITQTTDEASGDIILTVNRAAAHYLLETSKWGTFLSIMGFVLSGLIIVAALFIGSIISMMAQGQMDQLGNLPRGVTFFMGIIYMMMGLLYFFPSWYLFKYSRKLKSSLSSRDSSELMVAFENQKSLYRFWGIFTIIMIAIYGMMFLIFLLIAALR